MKFILLAVIFFISSARCLEYEILGRDTSWIPSDLQINVGDTVHWSWIGFHNVAHVNTAFENMWSGFGFRSGAPEINGEFSHTFTTPGVFYYICEVHVSFGMRGRIIVKKEGTSGSILSSHGLQGEFYKKQKGELPLYEQLEETKEASVGQLEQVEQSGQLGQVNILPTKETKAEGPVIILPTKLPKETKSSEVGQVEQLGQANILPTKVLPKETKSSEVGQVEQLGQANILPTKVLPKETKVGQVEQLGQANILPTKVLPKETKSAEVGQAILPTKAPKVGQAILPIKETKAEVGQAILPTKEIKVTVGQAVLPTMKATKVLGEVQEMFTKNPIEQGQIPAQAAENLPTKQVGGAQEFKPTQKQLRGWKLATKAPAPIFSGQAVLPTKATKAAGGVQEQIPLRTQGGLVLPTKETKAEVGGAILQTKETKAGQAILPTKETKAGQAILPTKATKVTESPVFTGGAQQILKQQKPIIPTGGAFVKPTKFVKPTFAQGGAVEQETLLTKQPIFTGGVQEQVQETYPLEQEHEQMGYAHQQERDMQEDEYEDDYYYY